MVAQVYSEDFTEQETGAIATASGAFSTAKPSSSSSIVDEMRTRSVAGSNSADAEISQELRDKFVVAAERQAAEEQQRLHARLKATQERAAVMLRQLTVSSLSPMWPSLALPVLRQQTQGSSISGSIPVHRTDMFLTDPSCVRQPSTSRVECSDST